MPEEVKSAYRDRWLTVRLTQEELERLRRQQAQTAYARMADYIRVLIFQKPVKVFSRDKSVDELMEELILLRTELNALGNNFNQVVRRINSLPFPPEILLQVANSLQVQLLEKLAGIQARIDQVAERW
ncbi:plasmid mobilization relaxosome protein MobC [Chitinophaga sp. XS-30]|uniref:plasmid mobilization protein n=1 Tax=Chitinophaga sp. XS-30 TaxID=2604421 RepID=UPI0011DD53BE|nr:plasmid mobilization relaxosome protein MobC [Chitinophaga sp. XS-30]QEH39464.1 plasmid mobilization relaxosome protein MobC [Chitinophaga sp. XS-30]